MSQRLDQGHGVVLNAALTLLNDQPLSALDRAAIKAAVAVFRARLTSGPRTQRS